MMQALDAPRPDPSRPGAAPAGASDMVLVARVRAGDAAAFESLMRRYNRRLFRVARGILRDPAEAEDVVQEAFVRAYSGLGGFVGPGGFAAWLTRIAVNDALGRLRRHHRHGGTSIDTPAGEMLMNSLDHSALAAAAARDNPERNALSLELRGLMEAAIDRLPDDFRAVFVLRAIEQLSVAETAESLGLRPATVKTRFHRARARLRTMLAEHFSAVWPETFPFAGARCDRVVATVFKRLDLDGRRAQS